MATEAERIASTSKSNDGSCNAGRESERDLACADIVVGKLENEWQGKWGDANVLVSSKVLVSSEDPRTEGRLAMAGLPERAMRPKSQDIL